MDIVCLIMGVVFYHGVGLKVFLESFFTRVDPCLKRNNSATVTPFLLKLMHCSMFSCSVAACTHHACKTSPMYSFPLFKDGYSLSIQFSECGCVFSCIQIDIYLELYLNPTLCTIFILCIFRQWPNACFKITGRC